VRTAFALSRHSPAHLKNSRSEFFDWKIECL